MERGDCDARLSQAHSSEDASSASESKYYNHIAITFSNVRYGVTANIIAFHAIARGSIPRIGVFVVAATHPNCAVPTGIAFRKVDVVSCLARKTE